MHQADYLEIDPMFIIMSSISNELIEIWKYLLQIFRHM